MFVFLKQQRMDRTFMFFDSKVKKGSKKVYQHSNHSRSNSSKYQPVKSSARLKPQLHKPVITQKQKEIRQAIQYRFARSKMNAYQYNNTLTQRRSTRKSSHSSEMEEFKHMKSLRVVNLKQFHDKLQLRNNSKNTSKDSKNLSKDAKNNKYAMKFKLKQNRSTIFRTEGSQPASREKNKYFSKYLDRTTSQLCKKKQQEWRFISIQVKGQQKIRKRKEETKINSHRTLQVEKNHSKSKTKSTEKYWQKVPKLKQLQKLNRNYKF